MRTPFFPLVLVALALSGGTNTVARAGEQPLGPAAIRFVGWSADEREAAFVQTLPGAAGGPSFRVVHLIDTESQNIVAHFRLPGAAHPVAIPQTWRDARPYAQWQALSRKSRFTQDSYSFADSTVRLRPIQHTPLVVRADQKRLMFSAEAEGPLNFEAVARLMDGSEASLGVFLQPCAKNQTLHGKLALYTSASGRHVLVLVDIWDAQKHLVDQDIRLVALNPAPLGHIAIGLRRANNEIAREVRETFGALHPRAQKHWDHHIGPLF